MKINVKIELGVVHQNVDLEVPDMLLEGADESLKRRTINQFIKAYVESNIKLKWSKV